MAYESLKAEINSNITTNGNQEITGAKLNTVLNDMVDEMGVSVSQNTNTGHTDINIGGNSYPVPSVGEVNQLGVKIGGLDGDVLLNESFTITQTGYISLNYTTKADVVISITAPLVLGRTIGVYLNSSSGLEYIIDNSMPLDGNIHLYALNIEKDITQLVFGEFIEDDLTKTIVAKITKAEEVAHEDSLNEIMFTSNDAIFGASEYGVLTVINEASVGGDITISGNEVHTINISSLTKDEIASLIANESFDGYTTIKNGESVIFQKNDETASVISVNAGSTGASLNYTITSNSVSKQVSIPAKYHKDGLLVKTTNVNGTEINYLKDSTEEEFISLVSSLDKVCDVLGIGSNSPASTLLNIPQDNIIATGEEYFGTTYPGCDAQVYVIPLPQVLYKKIAITAKSGKEANFAFVKSWYNPTIGLPFEICDGTEVYVLAPSVKRVYDIPCDCNYIVVGKLFNSSDTDRTPQKTECLLDNSGNFPEKIMGLVLDKFSFGKTRVIRIAASDSPIADKKSADYLCSGTHDEITIQKALNVAGNFSTIVFAEGNYNLSGFTQYGNSDRPTALFIPNSIKNITFLSTQKDRWENKTIFNVDMSGVSENPVSVLCASNDAGQNNRRVNVSNILIKLSTYTKPVIVIDCTHFCASKFNNVAIQSHPWNERPAITFPDVSVGIRGFNTNNNGFGLYFIDTFVCGFREGFQMAGEHIIMMECLGYSCHYAYTFGNFVPPFTGVWEHPITLINCSEESCDCLPLFANCGYFENGVGQEGLGLQNITFIDHTIELRYGSNPSRLPIESAEELHPGKFCGTITFTGNDSYRQNSTAIKFWKNGSGLNFDTRNSTHARGGNSALRSTYTPQFMQHYFDTTLNKEVICIDAENSVWVDCMGNPVN